MENICEEYMKLAIEEAKKAFDNGEVPVGAIVIKDGKIIGKGHNRREIGKDISSHAEIEALKDASKNTGDWRLDGCSLIVTLEPCLMCAGAILQARIGTLVFGAKDQKEGAIISKYHVYDEPRDGNRPLVYSGILGEECEDLLKRFFSEKRPN